MRLADHLLIRRALDELAVVELRAGKTTLLRVLAGLDALSDGHIVLDGRTLDNANQDTFVAAYHRPVGVVFQNYRLFPHLNVRDNVAFAARAQGP